MMAQIMPERDSLHENGVYVEVRGQERNIRLDL